MTRSWKHLMLAAAWLALPACDDEPECDDECAPGQSCFAGSDGEARCYCTPEENGGCPAGEQCLRDPAGDPACYCGTDSEAGCSDGNVCEEVPGGYPACFPPVTLGGRVFDMETDGPIEGAHVAARNANFAAVSGVAITDVNGHYELFVPTPRTPDGALLQFEVFLRADAQGYLTFPMPPRVPLPIDMSMASGSPPRLESTASNVGLIPLGDTAGLGSISGDVHADVPVGTLVVAGGASMTGGGVTGIAHTDGSYTVFNVPAGNVAVRGYKLGLQLAPTSADVAAGAETGGVDLALLGQATAVVDGKVEIVNPGDGQDTSVIFAVDETFIESAARGEAPPGLRIHPVSGAFSLTGVPDGNYVVLAAFENDFLVRDPDVAIGGTDIVRINVAGASFTIAESFKVTGSLNVVSPDKEERVSGMPTFIWSDDSGEDHYEVRVYDAYGTLVWENLMVPGVSGSMTVEAMYGGPALESGLLYQFRASSIKNGGSTIAITEDLRGVFLYQ